MKVYEVSVQSSQTVGGMYETKDGFGFWVQEIESANLIDKFSNVFVSNGTVYISLDLLGWLIGGRNAGNTDFTAKIGRRRLFDLQAEGLFERICRHLEYGNRNKIEEAVEKRNRAILDFLLGLL